MAESPQELKVALVTGAAGGIGLVTTKAFLDRGYRVGVADFDYQAAEEAVRGLDVGAQAIALDLDVRSTESVDVCVAQVVAQFGRLDVLANIAGTSTSNPLPPEEVPDEEWSRHIETHLGGTFRCSRAAFPHLAATGSGVIVNVSSLAAHRSIRQRAPYTAAKAGIEGLTRQLGVEWASKGVRVNAVAPGYIRTARLETAFRSGTHDESKLMSLVPQRRLGRAEEIANVIVFLSSEGASFIIGQTIMVDGGVSVDSQH